MKECDRDNSGKILFQDFLEISESLSLFTHSLSYSPTHSLTYSPTHLLIHSLHYTLTHPLTHSLIHSLTPHTHSPTHSLIHPLTHPLIILLSPSWSVSNSFALSSSSETFSPRSRATRRRLRNAIFPVSSSSNNLNAFSISSRGSLCSTLSDTG